MAFTSDTTRNWGKDFETTWGEHKRANTPSGTALVERNCDSRYYRQFWVNAVRWLASGRMGRTNDPVTLELAQSYCRPDESVTARVKVRDSELKEIASAEVALFLSEGAKTNPPIRAVYDPAARAYVAQVRPPKTGEFVVTAVANPPQQMARNPRAVPAAYTQSSAIPFSTARGDSPGGSDVLGSDRQLLVAESADLELLDLRARPDFMAALARNSHGENFNLSSGQSLSPAYMFAKAPAPKIEYRREPLWDKAVWLGVILGLLALEWTIRRVRGLA
jgi:hypothetical protein